MKTVKQDIDVYQFINTYPLEVAHALKIIIDEISSITQTSPTLWGKDIIGFGDTTYSNSYVKDQPYFKLGLRAASKHVTFYLNGYQDDLLAFADAYNIKHGKGCFHVKKAHEHLDIIRKLIQLSEKQ